MPHFLHDYDTATRSCFAVVDDYGNLMPCNQGTMLFIVPHHQLTTNWL